MVNTNFRILLVLFTTVGLFGVSLAQEKPAVREIAITAKKYEFAPNEIRVRRGEPVKLTITALDRKHGFKIEALDIDRELPKGEAVVIEFTAGRTGAFPIACSRFCGLGHGKMKGQLIVE